MPASDLPLLQIEDLCFAYPAHAGQPALPVFRHFSAQVGPGVTLLCGDESRGKTSLLRLLAGELQADAGRLRLVGGLHEPGSAGWRAEVAWCDLRERVHDALRPADCFDRLRQRHPHFSEHGLHMLIEGLDLGPHLDKALYMLSTGTRRKVGLAAVLASGARLHLLDDPFAALDRSAIDFLSDHLTQAAQSTGQAWLFAAYQAPRGVPLAGRIDLDAA